MLQEDQTKPEGQIHFFPIIFDGKQLYEVGPALCTTLLLSSQALLHSRSVITGFTSCLADRDEIQA